jgi:signal transduction histidine kinase
MDELAKANVALFESNRLKSEFLARVSHELRTPLNSIIGFAEVLRDQMAETLADSSDDAQAGKAARYADNILTSGRMLLELINDLLDLSKIEAGKMVVRYEKVVIADLVEAVIRFMRPAADKKNLQVSVTVAGELPLMETDGGKVQQILYNLFSNAVKFTPPRGSVSVSARREGEELILAVSDTGPGIPPEDQQAIFEKFHQLDSPATREHGGTGLGLAISRELAEMLGGRISLVSRLGEGTTFTVMLPLNLPAAPAPVK